MTMNRVLHTPGAFNVLGASSEKMEKETILRPMGSVYLKLYVP